MIRDVTFYETDTGNSPVEAFLDTLSTKQARKVAWVISLVEDMEIVPTEYFQKSQEQTISGKFESRRRAIFTGS